MRVVDALDILLAGGEQDSSYAKFRWMVRNYAWTSYSRT
jgi:hypothetical protein